jgi:hypothetical protein
MSSSSFRGTNRTPRTFTDGSVPSAIQRLTVLTETSAKRAILPARRKSGASVMSDLPVRGCFVSHAPARGGQIHGQLGAPAGARAQSAHRAPQIGYSWSMLTLVGACRPLNSSQQTGQNGQITFIFVVKRLSGSRAPGCARHSRKIRSLAACPRLPGSE